MNGLAVEATGRKTVMIDATSLERRRTKGGLYPKRHAVAAARARPLTFAVTATGVGDDIGPATLPGRAEGLPADRGDDAGR